VLSGNVNFVIYFLELRVFDLNPTEIFSVIVQVIIGVIQTTALVGRCVQIRFGIGSGVRGVGPIFDLRFLALVLDHVLHSQHLDLGLEFGVLEGLSLAIVEFLMLIDHST
jgi:hypothetical protein